MAEISGVTIDFSVSPRIITIPDTITDVTIQDLHDTLAAIEDGIDNGMQYPKLVSSAGKEVLTATKSVGITLTLQDAKLAFADRAGPTFIQCKITGGNLAAVDSSDVSIEPIQTTDFTQVINVQSSEATIITSADINVTKIDGFVAAAQQLAKSAKTIVSGTIDNSTFTPTTTQFEADDITEATSTHFKDRVIIFISGVLKDQAKDITAYSLQNSKGFFTCTAFTEAPANNDTFIIV